MSVLGRRASGWKGVVAGRGGGASDMVSQGILFEGDYEWDSLHPTGTKEVLIFRKSFLILN